MLKEREGGKREKITQDVQGSERVRYTFWKKRTILGGLFSEGPRKKKEGGVPKKGEKEGDIERGKRYQYRASPGGEKRKSYFQSSHRRVQRKNSPPKQKKGRRERAFGPMKGNFDRLIKRSLLYFTPPRGEESPGKKKKKKRRPQREGFPSRCGKKNRPKRRSLVDPERGRGKVSRRRKEGKGAMRIIFKGRKTGVSAENRFCRSRSRMARWTDEKKTPRKGKKKEAATFQKQKSSKGGGKGGGRLLHYKKKRLSQQQKKNKREPAGEGLSILKWNSKGEGAVWKKRDRAREKRGKKGGGSMVKNLNLRPYLEEANPRKGGPETKEKEVYDLNGPESPQGGERT